MPSLIEARQLHKFYTSGSKPLEVLCGIDLAIEAGDSAAILGASGAGKSTLLHILGSLDRPSAGQVLFEGRDLFSGSESKLSDFRNRTMGFVFQFHHLLPMLTARENTLLPALISGQGREAAGREADEMLRQVGLGDRREHRPAEMSGGEQQRVAIARALVMRPRVLFADEPTGNLDSHTGEEVAELLMELRQRHGMTLVTVTHNERLAGRLEKKLILSDGKLRMHAHP